MSPIPKTQTDTGRNRWKEAPCLFLAPFPISKKVERGPQQPQAVNNGANAQLDTSFAIFSVFLKD